MSDFNQSKYIQNWIKENKKQFRVDLDKDEYDNLEKMLTILKLKKSDFLRHAIRNLQISYECSDIIKDIKEQISLLGEQAECYVIYKKTDGYIIFIDCLSDEDFTLFEDEFSIKTTLKDALVIFENQNKIV